MATREPCPSITVPVEDVELVQSVVPPLKPPVMNSAAAIVTTLDPEPVYVRLAMRISSPSTATFTAA